MGHSLLLLLVSSALGNHVFRGYASFLERTFHDIRDTPSGVAHIHIFYVFQWSLCEASYHIRDTDSLFADALSPADNHVFYDDALYTG